MLGSVVAGDPCGSFAHVAADRAARRICGLSPIYSLLRLLPEVPGRLIEYRQWPDPEGAVTFSAVTFPGPPRPPPTRRPGRSRAGPSTGTARGFTTVPSAPRPVPFPTSCPPSPHTSTT